MSTAADGPPRFYGIYRGKVSDANDPTRKGRLRIIVPSVGGTKDALDWAMPCVPPGWFGGVVKPHGDHTVGDETLAHTENHTLLFPTPAAGARVWVMFEAGDARRPVWMGTWS